MAGLGMPYEQMAAIFGVSLSTFELALKKDNTLVQGLMRGRAKASAIVRESAFNLAKAGEPSMVRYWLNCREKWQESSKLEVTGADGAPLQVVVLPSNGREKESD